MKDGPQQDDKSLEERVLSGPRCRAPCRPRGVTVRALIMLVLLAGGGTGMLLQRARVEREALTHVTRAGGHAFFRPYLEDRSRAPLHYEPTSFQGALGIGLSYSVASLFAGDVEVDDDFMRHAARLHRLERLVVNGTKLTQNGFSHLKQFRALRELTVVSQTGSWVSELRGVSGFEKLSLVVRSGNADLRPLGRLSQLETLRLQFLLPTARMDLTPLEKLTHLGEVSLDLKVTDRDLVHLSPLRGLRSLEVPGQPVRDLHPLRSLHNLEYLRLPNTDVDDAGLASIENLSHLRELELGGTKVSDGGTATLRRLVALVSLSVGGTSIGDEGLKNIAALGHLELLDLSGTRVTDGGLASLSALNELRDLRLNGTRITNAGLAHIAKLKNCRHISVAGTSVSAEGIAGLKRTCPKIGVYFGP